VRPVGGDALEREAHGLLGQQEDAGRGDHVHLRPLDHRAARRRHQRGDDESHPSPGSVREISHAAGEYNVRASEINERATEGRAWPSS